MSRALRQNRIEKVDKNIQKTVGILGESTGFKRFKLTIKVFFLEALKRIQDHEVFLRAQSLSYFSLFSILPLIAAFFGLLGFLFRYSSVQERFEDYIDLGLLALPEPQRDVVVDFILQFKDRYLQALMKRTSGFSGVALLMFAWVIGRMLFNLEVIFDQIWENPQPRTFRQRITHYVFCLGVCVLALGIASAVPSGTPLLAFVALTLVFKSFPHKPVSLKSAVISGVFVTFSIGVSVAGFRQYVHWVGQTAYGKLALIPLLAYWVYVFWVVFILGIVVGVVVENGRNTQGQKNNISFF